MDSRESTRRVNLDLRISTIAQIAEFRKMFPQLTQGDIIDLLFFGFAGQFKLRIFDAIRDGAFTPKPKGKK